MNVVKAHFFMSSYETRERKGGGRKCEREKGREKRVERGGEKRERVDELKCHSKITISWKNAMNAMNLTFSQFINSGKNKSNTWIIRPYAMILEPRPFNTYRRIEKCKYTTLRCTVHLNWFASKSIKIQWIAFNCYKSGNIFSLPHMQPPPCQLLLYYVFVAYFYFPSPSIHCCYCVFPWRELLLVLFLLPMQWISIHFFPDWLTDWMWVSVFFLYFSLSTIPINSVCGLYCLFIHRAPWMHSSFTNCVRS